MQPFLGQLKKRRIQLELKQHDMLLSVGISRQQYQRLESKGNPRLDTLALIAQGLKSQILLIPQEKLAAVKAILDSDTADIPPAQTPDNQPKPLSDDPWQGLLEDVE